MDAKLNSEVVPEARYFHCASHQLNLALTKACAVTSVQCMLPDLQALGVFFKYSPKRQRCLETCTAVLNLDQKQDGKSEICSLKLKLLSATSRVERHTAISDFIKIYEAIIYCLEVICGQSPVPSIDQQSEAGMAHPEEINMFDAKSVTEANGLLRALSSDKFIVALHCNAFVSGYLKGLSVLLQGSHLDIIEAYSEISNTVKLFREHREKAVDTFRNIHDSICLMTSLFGRDTPEIPRLAARQTLRSNLPVSSPDSYRRASVFIPFIDSLISELCSRLTSLTQKAVQALLLLPANMRNLKEENIINIFSVYESDLPDASSYSAEINRWHKKWYNASQTPETLPVTLKETMEATNSLLYPNIARILHLLVIIPVTSANVERANLALKLIKTNLRSTKSQARLNALVLLFCHQFVPLNIDAVVNRFARAHPRRMLLLNPDQDESVALFNTSNVLAE